MNLRILVVSILAAALFLSVLSVPYANSQSSATTTTMTLIQPAGSGQCTVRSLAFLAVKGDIISGTYGSNALINFYILTQAELNSTQNCHPPSTTRPLFLEENAAGYDNYYSSIPIPANGTYYFVLIASGPRSVSSGYETVELSFPASIILINSTVSPSSITSPSTIVGANSISLSTTASPNSTSRSSTPTTTTIFLPSSLTSASSSVTPQASVVPAFRSFWIVGAVALAVVIALSASVVLFMRRKKTSEGTVTVEHKPLAQVPQPAANRLSTGYDDLDGLLAGGLPKGCAVLLLSPRCDERDLLLRKIIGSALSAGMPTFYLSNDPSKIQDMTSTYREDFYALSSQTAKIASQPSNLYKIPSTDSLSDLNTAFTKILELRVKQHGTRGRLLIVDLLAYSHIFLFDKGVMARKWFSDFLAKRKGEDFTVFAYLNPLVASNVERQTLIDVFDGVIEIYEKEVGDRSRRFLVIKRIDGHKFSDLELMLDKDKLV